MKRATIILGVLLPLLLAGAAGVLLYTETGLQWTFRQLQSLLPGELTAQRLTGRLAGPLEIAGLQYRDESIAVTGDHLAIAWRPARLLAGRIHIERLEAAGLDVTVAQASSGRQGGSGVTLPLPVRVVDALGRDIRIRLPGREPFLVNRLDFRFSAAGDHVQLDAFRLQAPLARVNANGRLPLHSDGALRLEARWQAVLEGRQLEGQGTLQGTLAHIEAEQHLNHPIGLHVSAQLDTAAQPLRWRAEVEADPFPLTRLFPEARSVHFSHGRLRAQGEGAIFQADGAFHMQDSELGAWRTSVEAEWDGSSWRIPAFTLAALEGETRIRGSAGQRAPPDAGARTLYDLELEWTELSWPPVGQTVFASPRGSASATGRPSDYRLRTEAELDYGELPAAALHVNGHGDLSSLSFDTVQLGWLEGRWNGRGSLAWADSLQWGLRLDARDVNPAALRAGLDGSLNARVGLDGRGVGNDFRFTGQVTQLEGSLRGSPLTGSGRFAYDQSGLDIRSLELRSGPARLQASAQMGARWDITWRLHAPDLSRFYPGLTGELQTHGDVKGRPDALKIDTVLQASAIAYHESSAASVQAAARIDLGKTGPWLVDVAADQTRIRDRELGEVRVHGKGNSASHTISLAVAGDRHLYEQTIDGAFTEQRWRARLRDGVIEHGLIGRWQQHATADLTAAFSSVEMAELCWRRDPNHLCLDGVWRRGNTGNASLVWEEIDLGLLDPWLSAQQIELSGRSDGRLRVAFTNGELTDGSLDAAAGHGAASYPLPLDGERHILRFERARLAIAADAEGGLRVNGDVILNEAERLSVRAGLPSWNSGTPVPDHALPVNGSIALRLRDLSAITLYLPDVLPSDSRLEADLTVSGLLGTPRLDGTVDLDVGQLAVARLGITLEDLDLNLQLKQSRWQLQGAARSGSGRVTARGHGQVRDLDRWDARLELAGADVQALRRPTAEVVVSPDITLDLAPGDIAFAGVLHIPAATIEPQLQAGTAAASEDVVVVGDEVTAGPRPARHVHGTIELVPGDEVRIEGRGFAGRVAGRLRITVDRGGEVTADGALEIVDGRYEAYGQKLKITQGRLLYAGGPVDDPAIDIIATRTIDEVEVGIRATGTAQRPLLELFSAPSMDDADILSYLILGQPLNQATGDDQRLLYRAATSVALIGGEAVAERIADEFNLEEVAIQTGDEAEAAALVLGKYLSPRLYVRYIQGLVDNTSAFQIRYELSERWTLETESGTQGAGADLLFTLER